MDHSLCDKNSWIQENSWLSSIGLGTENCGIPSSPFPRRFLIPVHESFRALESFRWLAQQPEHPEDTVILLHVMDQTFLTELMQNDAIRIDRLIHNTNQAIRKEFEQMAYQHGWSCRFIVEIKVAKGLNQAICTAAEQCQVHFIVFSEIAALNNPYTAQHEFPVTDYLSKYAKIPIVSL